MKELRKLYRAGQGELESTHFINLVFGEDAGMLEMLEQAGCDGVPKLTGLLVELIDYYLGVECRTDHKRMSSAKEQEIMSGNRKANKKGPIGK